jgi:ribonuclease HI
MGRWNYYAVAVGREIGIFKDWDTTFKQINGYPGALHKGFKTLPEAQAFIHGDTAAPSPAPLTKVNPMNISATSSMASAVPSSNVGTISAQNTDTLAQNTDTAILLVPQMEKIIAYTDGSFRDYGKGPSSGYGVILIYPDGQVVHGYGHVPLPYGNTNNVAELYAIWVAINATPTIKHIDIYTDSKYSIGALSGINNVYANVDLISAIKQSMKDRTVSFYKVIGHSGLQLNDMVDGLANQGSASTNDIPKWEQHYVEAAGKF